MKKLLFAVTLAGLMGLGASASEVTSANTFGVLKVNSSTKETIICVPWVKVGTGGDINVADLVMTSNLTDGDQLYYYDNSAQGDAKYKAWVLGGDGKWGAPKMVTTIGETASTTEATVQTAARGDALILVRQYPTEGNVAKPIYLYGQYTSETFDAPAMTAGAWNLIAYPNTAQAALDLNQDLTWNGCADGDTIIVQASNGNAVSFEYNSSKDEGQKWGRHVLDKWVYLTAKIQPGMGAWYHSTGASTPSYAKKSN